ncbi:low affinity immunoglobulin gamma Fc region receptor III-B isoform X1 [Oryctolagus cuniculus]|uniref:low affinity immunoglobulin gamma Fc region receptor III-B isoform X1 n=1 Tax=Oryctolagus cuniculus TaxID=9986 RepID=UPI0038792723
MGQPLPPVALLLLVSASSRAADVPKALVLLDPPWASVLKDDHVTLKCQGLHPAGDNTTQWLHNGSLLSSQAPAYTITAARAEDGGEYRCQTGLSSLSDPVQLRVHLDWLVLQAPRWVFQEGEPIQLRCHSWKNKNLHKVTYLQNGRGLRYFHQNSDLHIPEATRNHSGSYFCRGLIGHHNVSSETVTITVQGPANPVVSSSVLPWHQIAFCLVMGLLLAADTGLYFSVQRDLRSSQRARKEHTLGWSLGSQDK